MAIKAYVTDYLAPNLGDNGISFQFGFADTNTGTIIDGNQDALQINVDLNTFTPDEAVAAIQTKVLAYASAHSYSMTAADIIWGAPNLFTKTEAASIKAAVVPRSFTNNATHTIQTVAAAANGFQLSTTRDAMVNYAATIVTAATLASGAVGSVVLEIASTNSSSAGAWQEIGRISNGQVFSLAVAIGCTQTVSGQVGGVVPAGYYARLRSINTTGTPTYTYNSGQEVLL